MRSDCSVQPFDQSNPTYNWSQLIQIRKEQVALRRGSLQRGGARVPMPEMTMGFMLLNDAMRMKLPWWS